MASTSGSPARASRAARVEAPPTSSLRSRLPVPRAWRTPTPASSSRQHICWMPVPEAPTMPTGPGRTALAKPRPTPRTMAVPAPGPITRRPRRAASCFRATSWARGTLSLKTMTDIPARRASMASTKACGPGTEMRARSAPVADPTRRGRGGSNSPPDAAGAAARAASAAAMAVVAAASSDGPDRHDQVVGAEAFGGGEAQAGQQGAVEVGGHGHQGPLHSRGGLGGGAGLHEAHRVEVAAPLDSHAVDHGAPPAQAAPNSMPVARPLPLEWPTSSRRSRAVPGSPRPQSARSSAAEASSTSPRPAWRNRVAARAVVRSRARAADARDRPGHQVQQSPVAHRLAQEQRTGQGPGEHVVAQGGEAGPVPHEPPGGRQDGRRIACRQGLAEAAIVHRGEPAPGRRHHLSQRRRADPRQQRPRVPRSPDLQAPIGHLEPAGIGTTGAPPAPVAPGAPRGTSIPLGGRARPGGKERHHRVAQPGPGAARPGAEKGALDGPRQDRAQGGARRHRHGDPGRGGEGHGLIRSPRWRPPGRRRPGPGAWRPPTRRWPRRPRPPPPLRPRHP